MISFSSIVLKITTLENHLKKKFCWDFYEILPFFSFFLKSFVEPQASAYYTRWSILFYPFFLQDCVYTSNHSGLWRGLAAFRLIRSSIFPPFFNFSSSLVIFFPFSTTINLAPSPESRVPLAVRVLSCLFPLNPYFLSLPLSPSLFLSHGNNSQNRSGN